MYHHFLERDFSVCTFVQYVISANNGERLNHDTLHTMRNVSSSRVENHQYGGHRYGGRTKRGTPGGKRLVPVTLQKI